ncbi:MAG: hypothetical protein A2Y97_02295 [Nitrospirae bacterium RBG_13_39_12]|nr:MAG: hypothetical protein A2Y97_02295 [Nitrospirae bacterium RBG_13_39_12]
MSDNRRKNSKLLTAIFGTMRLRHWFLVLCAVIVFAGCASVQEYIESSGTSQGQVSILLKGRDKTSLDITFKLLSVNIVSEDGRSTEVMSTPVDINSLNLAGKQILIAEKSIHAGRYKKMQFTVKEALIKRDGKLANLALPPEGIAVDIDVTVDKNQNTSLFLDWDVDESLVDGYLFSPVFNVKSQVPELATLLIYVTNEDSDNVTVINRQLGDIVANVMVGKKPRGIAVSQGRDKPRVYVVNSGSNSISVIDPTTNKLEVEIPMRFGINPEGIAIARISPERELIFVTNYGSNNVSVIDVLTNLEIEKINVGDGPVAIAVDPPIESISGTRFLSFDDLNSLRSYREKFFNVYVVNKNSKDISVIRMDIQSNRSDQVLNINVEWNPIALAVDYQRGKVYVANYNYDALSVIDILQITKGNTTASVSAITNVGTSVTGVITDTDLDRIFLLKDAPGEIMIIRPFSEVFSSFKTTMALSPVVGSITVGNSPRSLLLDPEGRKIYVVNRGSDNVYEIDKTTKRVERIIPVGKRPYGIAMFTF